MTSQVEKRERPLSGHIWLLGRQRVSQEGKSSHHSTFYWKGFSFVESSTCQGYDVLNLSAILLLLSCYSVQIQGPLKGNRQNKNKPQVTRNLSNRNLGTPKLQRRNRYQLSFYEDVLVCRLSWLQSIQGVVFFVADLYILALGEMFRLTLKPSSVEKMFDGNCDLKIFLK